MGNHFEITDDQEIVSELLFPCQPREKSVDELLALCDAFLEATSSQSYIIHREESLSIRHEPEN